MLQGVRFAFCVCFKEQEPSNLTLAFSSLLPDLWEQCKGRVWSHSHVPTNLINPETLISWSSQQQIPNSSVQQVSKAGEAQSFIPTPGEDKVQF